MTAYVRTTSLSRLPLWKKIEGQRKLVDFSLEITARCNLNCRHCYVNRPAGDSEARQVELSREEIGRFADEAVKLGALWCTITGGEPLLRPDFPEIYLDLKRKGLLVSLYTNATLIRNEHAQLFRRYPPRDIEVTLYGASPAVYEAVTRVPGSFDASLRGVERLKLAGIPFRVKAMIMRTNVAEAEAIGRLGRAWTRDYFRFDPFLHLRYDRDPARNAEIRAQRLPAEDIAALEMADIERRRAMLGKFERVLNNEFEPQASGRLFCCGIGEIGVELAYNGHLRACPSLCHPDFVYDWRRGSLADAWNRFFPAVLCQVSDRKEFRERCCVCRLVNLCLWCPAQAALETGEPDSPIDFFCEIAHARLAALRRARGEMERLPPTE